MKKVITLFLFLFLGLLSFGQDWSTKTIKIQDLESPTLRENFNKGFYREIDFSALKSELLKAGKSYATAKEFFLPTPEKDGMLKFKIWETPCMALELASRYPNIRTYTAELVGNRFVTAKIDITENGFHALVFDGTRTYVVEPISRTNLNYYGFYYKKEMEAINMPTCQNSNEENNWMGEIIPAPNTVNRTNGTQLKTYRLALACTYEYSMAVAGPSPTKPTVLSEMVTIINRVNGVYEREIAVHLELISNTDDLIYLTSSDPYSNSNGFAMLGQNISNINFVIGSSNYDIGHVFSTGGGGVAYLGCVCGSDKAGGVTGLPSPFGDVFAIDYVAHEMGHQFGANHTFNSSIYSCSGNGNTATAFEPGSGSTIMAYAGICGADNLQSNSDAYFHIASLKEISTFITSGTGATCPVLTSSGNTPNTIDPISPKTFTIPTFTPFELTAPNVSDATADTLLYCWEEYDLGGFGSAWSSSNNAMPFFRTFMPVFSPTRVFPKIDKILEGNYDYLGERLPKNARNLNFVLTVRDIYAGYGAFNSTDDGDTVKIAVVSHPDTFRVTSQTTPVTWMVGSSQTVTWDVAGTDAYGINATNVDIYLSLDSAATFPVLLASSVPNTGSATITVPGTIPNTTKARVKVKGSGNIFFQINTADITIDGSTLGADFVSFNLSSLNNCTNKVSWQVGSTKDISWFWVEKSKDGRQFECLEKIKIEDNEISNFSIVDSQLNTQEKTFYRIVAVAPDGNTKYSSIKWIQNECGQNYYNIYPNPLSQNLLSVEGLIPIQKIELLSVDGRVLFVQDYIHSINYKLDLQNISPGVYLLKVKSIKGTETVIKVSRL